MTKRVFEMKWFNENGLFSKEGIHAMMHFKDGLQDLVHKDEIKELTISQLEILKSNLLKMVSDAISDEITKKRKVVAQLSDMTDAEFLSYLDARYGEEFWPIVNGGLSREEEDRIPPTKIRELLEKETVRIKNQETIMNYAELNGQSIL